MWKYYALLSAFFAALTTVFAKLGLRNINADLATAVRTFIVLLVSWGVVLWSGRTREVLTMTASSWLYLLLSGIATGLSWLYYFRALQSGPTASVNALDKSSVLLVLVFSILMLQETLNLKIVIGTILIFTGTLILVL